MCYKNLLESSQKAMIPEIKNWQKLNWGRLVDCSWISGKAISSLGVKTDKMGFYDSGRVI